MDLAKNILHSISTAYPISFSYEGVNGQEKELEKMERLGVIQKRTALTFPCGGCGSYCEIKTLEDGTQAIFCDTCEDARLYALTEAEKYEYAVSLPQMLAELLKEFELSTNHISEVFKNRLWSMGIHTINGVSRELLFLRELQGNDTEILSFLEQKKALHPIVFSAISQRRLLNTKYTFFPLENVLASRGAGIFSKKQLKEYSGKKGKLRVATALF